MKRIIARHGRPAHPFVIGWEDIEALITAAKSRDKNTLKFDSRLASHAADSAHCIDR